jgi:hypothetical protein
LNPQGRVIQHPGVAQSCSRSRELRSLFRSVWFRSETWKSGVRGNRVTTPRALQWRATTGSIRAPARREISAGPRHDFVYSCEAWGRTRQRQNGEGLEARLVRKARRGVPPGPVPRESALMVLVLAYPP